MNSPYAKKENRTQMTQIIMMNYDCISENPLNQRHQRSIFFKARC